MRNIQVVDIVVKQYGNVSLHVGIVDTIPQFHATTKKLWRMGEL
jgi:hypothetical protein